MGEKYDNLHSHQIVRLNPPQVFTLKWFVSLVFLGHHIVVLFNLFIFALYDMIYYCLTNI